MPLTIGVVTSLSGAVLHDIRRVLARRWPTCPSGRFGLPGAGPGCGADDRRSDAPVARWTDDETGRATDVVILARGGGSLEDLWPFNDEAVVRAVAAHPCPMVVGVGHETDVTLAEFVADVRAATPSVAAELIVPSRADEQARVAQLGTRLNGSMARSLADRRQLLDTETRALEGDIRQAQIAADRERVGLLLDRAARLMRRRLEIDRSTLDRAGEELPALAAGRLAAARAEFARQSAALGALSPYATLERGYSIVRGPTGAVLRDSQRRQIGRPTDVRLQRGEVGARVGTRARLASVSETTPATKLDARAASASLRCRSTRR